MTPRKIRTIVKWLIPDRLFYGYLVPFVKKITRISERKKSKLRFQINIADHCNLNCKGCTAFSPLAEKNYLDTAVFERDCSRLSELTGGEVELIDLLGGEPLLHPEINKILKTARKHFPSGAINIVSNGILLKNMPEDFWATCSTNDITIIVSGYKVKIDIDSIKHIAEKNGVVFKMRGNASDIKIWNKVPFDLAGKQNIVKNFKTCFGANFCISLDNGKLATCPIPFVIKHFNKYFNQNIPVAENDYVDIYTVKNIEEIFDFLRKPPPICAYCDLDNIDYGVEWGISKREIREWI